MYILACVYIYTHTDLYMYIDIHTCLYTDMCIYIYIHTYSIYIYRYPPPTSIDGYGSFELASTFVYLVDSGAIGWT